jgi:hypothetical protein
LSWSKEKRSKSDKERFRNEASQLHWKDQLPDTPQAQSEKHDQRGFSNFISKNHLEEPVWKLDRLGGSVKGLANGVLGHRVFGRLYEEQSRFW